MQKAYCTDFFPGASHKFDLVALMELEVSFVSLLHVVCANLVVVCMCVATSKNSFILTYHDSFAIRFFPAPCG